MSTSSSILDIIPPAQAHRHGELAIIASSARDLRSRQKQRTPRGTMRDIMSRNHARAITRIINCSCSRPFETTHPKTTLRKRVITASRLPHTFLTPSSRLRDSSSKISRGQQYDPHRNITTEEDKSEPSGGSPRDVLSETTYR